MKTKLKQRKNPTVRIQGSLLLEKMTEKYEEYGHSVNLMEELKKLFDKYGTKMIHSTTGDEIYYFNENLKQAIAILKKIK